MSQDVTGATEAVEAVGPPERLSGRLEQLAQERSPNSVLRGELDTAVEDALELEAEVGRLVGLVAAAEARRVERLALEQRVVDAESAAEELHGRLDVSEAALEVARERVAQLEAEVDQLRDPDAVAFARRLQAFEAVGRKHAPSDGAAELLRLAQWLAEGSLDAVVEVQPLDVEDVADWLHKRVVAIDVLDPDTGGTWQQTGLLVQAVHSGGRAGADLTLRGPAGQLGPDGQVKRP